MVSAVYKDIRDIVEVLRSPQAIYEIVIFCIGNIHLIFIVSVFISSKARKFYILSLERIFILIAENFYKDLKDRLDKIESTLEDIKVANCEILSNTIEYECSILLKKDKIYRNDPFLIKVKRRHPIYKSIGGNGEIDKIVKKVIDKSIDDIGG